MISIFGESLLRFWRGEGEQDEHVLTQLDEFWTARYGIFFGLCCKYIRERDGLLKSQEKKKNSSVQNSSKFTNSVG